MLLKFLQDIKADIQAVFENDPSAKNKFEVLIAYPGLHALWFHRIAHFMYKRRFYTTARLLSHINRFFTGIEIHPGAKIGQRVFIDHGMGIVIGETAEIGDNCLLYKGVVLGGTTLEKKKRHPTLGKGVVVGSNACILGDIIIGDGARIGSGSVVVKSVPPYSTVVGVPGKVLKKNSPEDGNKLEHADLPDPLIELLGAWMNLLEKYEERIQKLEAHHDIPSINLANEFRKDIPFLSLNNNNGRKVKVDLNKELVQTDSNSNIYKSTSSDISNN